MNFWFVFFNTINILLLVVFPLVRWFGLFRLLHEHRDEIKFTRKIEWLVLPTLEQLKNKTAEVNRYVECRIDISPNDYITWKIGEDGNLIRSFEIGKGSLWRTECVVHYTKRKLRDSDPLSSLALRYTFMQYEVKRVWLMGWLTRKYLEHITAEPYVIAKLTGIELDDPLGIDS